MISNRFIFSALRCEFEAIIFHRFASHNFKLDILIVLGLGSIFISSAARLHQPSYHTW